MKKVQRDSKFGNMKARYLRLPAHVMIILIVVFLTGCNALKRGDFLQQSDDTLYFSQIGFLMADNPGLSRDAVTDVKGFDQDLWITVPYDADTTLPLVINYNVVGKDTIVEYENPPSSGTFLPLVSGIDSLTFNIGSSPVEQKLRILKQGQGGAGSNSREFTIHVDKIIRPVLLNPPEPGISGPFTGTNAFQIAFEDEDGSIIPNLLSGTWNPDTGANWNNNVRWDDWRMEMIGPLVLNPAPADPENYAIDVKLFFPGDHQIEFYGGLYTDINGYVSQQKTIDFTYEPPPVYLSQAGNDSNNGLTPSTPVKTWPKAYEIAETTSIFDIYIEASETPYDTAGANKINGTTPLHPNWPVSIFGSWKPGFNGRYTEDWENRTPTILTNSSQSDGANFQNTSSVLNYHNVSSEFVLDGVSLQPSNVVDYGTALMTEWGRIRVNDCQFFTPPGSSGNAIAANITAVSSPSDVQFRESMFIGKSGGSNKSTGLRVNGSEVSLGGCIILAGDLDDSSNGISTGIEASDSDISIWWSYILAGVITPENNSFTEKENFGIVTDDTDLNMDSVWIQSMNSQTLSRAVSFNVSNGGGSSGWINDSTIISGTSGESTALYLDNQDNAESLHLFNSVLIAGEADSGASTGILIANRNDSQIMGNAIHVDRSTTAAQSFGIHLVTAAGSGADIRNNLIWSTKSNQTLGIKFDAANPNGVNISHNDFWNTGGSAELDIGNGNISLAEAQATTTYFTGNIGIPIDVDITYDSAAGEVNKEDLGRVIGTPPIDVMLGGEDLAGLPSPPPDHDRIGQSRTSYAGLGWSIGPYEYDSAPFPQIIYVSEPAFDGSDDVDGNIGDDGHPLGTRQAPFASLARAYDIARTAVQLRTDVMEICISEGSYDMNYNTPITSSMPDINTTPDIHILGGYDKTTWTRDPKTNVTELYRDGDEVLRYNTINTDPHFSRDSLLEGFTIRNINTGGTGIGLAILGKDDPTIRNNTIIIGGTTISGSSGGPVNEAIGITISPEANPVIIGNTIYAGDNNNNNTGISISEAGALIVNNVIHSGTTHNIGTGYSTLGIIFTDNDTSTDNNPVYVFNNTIYAGDGGNRGGGIESSDTNLFAANNLLIAGTAAGVNSWNALRLGGPANSPWDVSNNLLLFGPPDSDRHAVDSNGTSYDTVSSFEDFMHALAPSRTAAGNLMDGTSQPSDYFILSTIAPGMTEAQVMAEDWHLNDSGPQDARYGGQDLSEFFNTDKDGKARTVPWSIGAYEY